MALKVYLGLGSNEGDRRANLETAVLRIRELSSSGKCRVSPIYETPALLPEGAPASWNKPYLNLVVQTEFAQFDESPQAVLAELQRIEAALGRGVHEYWSPRTIDIDILFWGDRTLETNDLTIPHPRARTRAFVLDPLKDLDSRFIADARRHAQHAPLWMGVLNITPDSFSDGGQCNSLSAVLQRLDVWDAAGVPILDVGAESTRPGAVLLSPEEEWQRLEPVLSALRERYAGRILKPLISVDTRYGVTAARAIELGADIINDVSGLSDSAMLAVLRSSEAQYVLMHSVSIPANPAKTLDAHKDPMPELLDWFQNKLKMFEAAGISTDRLILDPGIGFGKTALQSIEIMRQMDQFLKLPCRVLVGHSRKSFLSVLGVTSPADRDLETVGASLQLAGQGVDILRVHEPVMHMRAAQAWNHLNKSGFKIG